VTPCNALLGEFARQACAAIRSAGGVPFDFASISVADSMSMNHGGMRYSLVSREIIADASRRWRRAMPTTRSSPSPAAIRRCPA